MNTSLDWVLQPWIAEPFQLITWWDMEQFSAEDFFYMSAQLSSLMFYAEQAQKSEPTGVVTADSIKAFGDLIEDITGKCEKLGLSVSVMTAGTLLTILKTPGMIFGKLAPHVHELRANIGREMQLHLFFHVPAAQAKFYDQKELFGPNVGGKFPAIQFDMVEASNCYALGRGTACVFHLMRIMEVGVQQLGTKLGVALAAEKNWQNILDEVNKALKALPPKAESTIAMSQASANLYAVKLAWRNEVMHPNDTYTLEEAENLILQVKLFMKQLAGLL